MSDEIDKTLSQILGGMTAEADQAIEATKNMAKMLAAFNAGLVAEGFARDEALVLTNTYLTSIFVMMSNDGEAS